MFPRRGDESPGGQVGLGASQAARADRGAAGTRSGVLCPEAHPGPMGRRACPRKTARQPRPGDDRGQLPPWYLEWLQRRLGPWAIRLQAMARRRGPRAARGPRSPSAGRSGGDLRRGHWGPDDPDRPPAGPGAGGGGRTLRQRGQRLRGDPEVAGRTVSHPDPGPVAGGTDGR